MRITMIALLAALTLLSVAPGEAQWAKPKADAIPEADGFVKIPHAALPPQKGHIYRAIFNATEAAEKPTQLVPAVNMAGSELNALAAMGIPLKNAQFVIIFHGAAMDGLLDEDAYNAKFGVNNPNIKVLAAMKKAGVELFVCGQNLIADKIDPATLTPYVTLASDALIVLMEYQNRGYALMEF